MTRVDRSPEQLNAEAAQPLEERDLEAAIALHRALYRTDLNWLMKLHVRDGESGLGPPFSPVFEAFLDGRLGQFPYSKALTALRYACRRDHRPKHVDRDEWRGSLCHALVSYVIRQDYALDAARTELGLADAAKSRRTLDNALLWIERRLEEMAQQQDQAQRATVTREPREWMHEEPHRHRALDGLHSVDCENPVCRDRRAA